MTTWKRRIERHDSELLIKFTNNLNGRTFGEREARTANKNYITIGVSVLIAKFSARNNGVAARQESNPKSPTVYSSVRCTQC
jgi:hypothetical protein